jgi:hypothetical protein
MPLDRAEAPRRIADRSDLDPHGLEPDILRPGRGARRTRGEREPAVHDRDLAQLLEERLEEPFRREISRLGGAQ